MSTPQYESLAELFKALAHPTRIWILQLLRGGEKCVCEIVPELDMEQSNVSRHLAVLKKEGVLESRKEGLKAIYYIKDARIYELLDMGSDILKSYWQDKLESGGLK